MIDAVIDLSHHNTVSDFGAARGSGILGLIHKATQGTTFTDPDYASRRAPAQAAGLLWGAYHFGIGGDGAAQAQYFLSVAQPAPGTLLVLDFEENSGGASMTIEQAEQFVGAVEAATGRWPGLYGGSYLKQLLGAGTNPTLASCWLWLSQYGSSPTFPPNWPMWTLWQYTDGTAGPDPQPVPGVGACDRDQYNGSAAQLAGWWNGG